LNYGVTGKDAPMQTIKSVIVVGLLLTVCYGAYKAMNAPDVEMPEDLKTWADQNGKDVLPDFEIPAITSNDPLGVPGGQKPIGSSSDTSPPMFPAVDFSPANNLSLNQRAGNSDNSNAGQTIELPKLPAMNSLPSVPASFAPEKDGPAIPFNPSMPTDTLSTHSSGANLLASSSSSIANELIDAGSGDEVSLPLLESPKSPTIETFTSTSIPADAGADHKATQPTQPFPAAKSEALQMASRGKLKEALELMSQYYESPDLGYAEHTDLVDILDALTREVIYSDRHLLTSPHTVAAQDTLQNLATKFNLNPEFLAAVNKMGSSQALVPNSQIKVIEGPFHAQVSLSRGELTLFLRKLYAGRFPVSISQKNRPPQARYEIVDRRQDRTFYGANVRIPAGDPTNPYGGFWLSLGSDYAIHGSPEQVTSDLENVGCISLAPLDAADVYRILGKGAAVEIKP
jgi:lipoprotein-anchoring transpeptidase ErfK/SrfK